MAPDADPKPASPAAAPPAPSPTPAPIAAQAAEAEQPYPFEQEMDGRRRRKPGESKAAARTLLARLRVPTALARAIEEGRSEAWRALVDYGMQVPVCIAWYQQEVRRKQRQQTAFTVLLWVLLLITVVAVALIAWLAPDSKSSVLMAQLGVLLSGLLGVAKALAGAVDFQKQRSGFWEAAAKLKENLYTLEGAFRGKAVVDGALSQEFIDALCQATREARKIIAAEQRDFFDALASPTRVIELFQSTQGESRTALGELRGARATALTDLNNSNAEAERRERAARLRAARLEKLEAEEELRRHRASGAASTAESRDREVELQARIDRASYELRRLEILQDGAGS